MGVSTSSFRFQNIPSLCFHLKRSPVPSLVPTNLPGLSCLLCTLTLRGLCVKVCIELHVLKAPSHCGGEKSLPPLPGFLGQKTHWQERNHHKSIREARAKGAWKTWQSALSCQLCSWEAEVGVPPFQSQPGQGNSLSQGGGTISIAFSQNILLFP